MIKRLADFDGFAETVATMVKWVHELEHLAFTMLVPFHEADGSSDRDSRYFFPLP